MDRLNPIFNTFSCSVCRFFLSVSSVIWFCVFFLILILFDDARLVEELPSIHMFVKRSSGVVRHWPPPPVAGQR